ncbi:MAG: glycosyltransferase involved in cell wall biosynthesis [Glaciecola sp.]|jgi:glycosyltransferase involved in cell wall biosynthesis
MNILALDPWMGGSHSQLLEGWAAASPHSIDLLGLPARHWKWRLAGGAWALARQIRKESRPIPDALWVSDFVDLPQLRAFLPPGWAQVPALLYFHENQLTYPRPVGTPYQEDLAPGWTHILSCLAADGIAFNSAFHQQQFREASETLIRRLPKPKPTLELQEALREASVIYPGIDSARFPVGPGPGEHAPLRIAFNHRWEYDKGPLVWLETAKLALQQGARLELVLLGERSENPGPNYETLLAELAPHILVRGHLPSRVDYAQALGQCDLVVSCAIHEFYGMALLEAVSAGCTPLAPATLAYPEVLNQTTSPLPLYESPEQRLQLLLEAAQNPGPFRSSTHRTALHAQVLHHDQSNTHARLDLAMERLL